MGDQVLGNGYVLTSNGNYSSIIRSTTDPYRGAGLEVIPPAVIKANFDRNFVVALSKDAKTEKLSYWIINKDSALGKESGLNWQERKWANVSGPLDSLTFHQILSDRNINLALE